jgi:hypothetical protein
MPKTFGRRTPSEVPLHNKLPPPGTLAALSVVHPNEEDVTICIDIPLGIWYIWETCEEGSSYYSPLPKDDGSLGVLVDTPPGRHTALNT